jgi:hypothetical protein
VRYLRFPVESSSRQRLDESELDRLRKQDPRNLPEHYTLILAQAALSIDLNYTKSVGIDNGTKDAWEQAHNETTLIIDLPRKVIVSSGEQSECICQDRRPEADPSTATPADDQNEIDISTFTLHDIVRERLRPEGKQYLVETWLPANQVCKVKKGLQRDRAPRKPTGASETRLSPAQAPAAGQPRWPSKGGQGLAMNGVQYRLLTAPDSRRLALLLDWGPFTPSGKFLVMLSDGHRLVEVEMDTAKEFNDPSSPVMFRQSDGNPSCVQVNNGISLCRFFIPLTHW